MENEILASKNIQRNAFQLTINNPLDYRLDHLGIKKILIEEFSTIKYFCMADEVGEQGTPHTHIYVCFSSRVRFNTLKKHFPQAHIEPAKGTVTNNIEYIKKSGKWENTDKAETSIKGSYEDWGNIPIQKGKNADMQELYELIEAGYSNADIISINQDYILNIDKLDKVRTTLLIEKYKGHRRLNLRVIYISGATGTGKTRGILDEHGDGNVYRVTDYQHPFDGYTCQKIIAFDEYRSALKISDMLQYCDIYPIELPSRYANKFACYETVYIVSNWALEDQYREVQQDHPETWNAFLRRISEVRTYDKDGTVSTYDSAEKYLHRHYAIRPLTKEELEALPFKEE